MKRGTNILLASSAVAFISGLVPWATWIWIQVIEAGDPPDFSNDAFEHRLTVIWVALTILGIALAGVAFRHGSFGAKVVFYGFTVAFVLLGFIAWFCNS